MKIGDYLPERPSLKHIIEGDNPVLSIFLRGHLVIEALLFQMILMTKKMSDKKIAKMSCSEKIEYCYNEKLVTFDLKTFLIQVNLLRNKFSHRLGYNLTKKDVHQLIKLAGKSPEIDFSDDMHTLDSNTLYEWYGDTAGVLCEMFKHVAMDISFIVEANGGEFMFTR